MRADSGSVVCAAAVGEPADCDAAADAADPDGPSDGEAPTVLSCDTAPCCDDSVGALAVAPGPLGCGIAGPLLPAAARERESSFRLMVYDRNGGSSDEVAGAPVSAVPGGIPPVGVPPGGVWTDLPLGPDSSSGTNNTIRMTRMIAPVSLSFTRNSTVGTEPASIKHLVYAKPLQGRTHGVHRAEDNDSITGNRRSASNLTTLFHGCCERNLVQW